MKIDIEATRASLVRRGLIDAADGRHPEIPAWPCAVLWPIETDGDDGVKRLTIGVCSGDSLSPAGYSFAANALNLTSAGDFGIAATPSNPVGLNQFLNAVRIVERHIVWQQEGAGER